MKKTVMATEEIKNVRAPDTKLLSVDKRTWPLRKDWEDMLKDKYYSQSYILYKRCIEESIVYYSHGLNKLLEEDAEALDKMGTDFGEAVSKLVDNRCQKLGWVFVFNLFQSLSNILKQNKIQKRRGRSREALEDRAEVTCKWGSQVPSLSLIKQWLNTVNFNLFNLLA